MTSLSPMGCGFFIFFQNPYGGVKKTPMRDRAVWCESEESIAEQLQKEDWVDVEIKEQLRQHHIEYFDIPAYLESEIARECEIQKVLRKKRKRNKSIDMILRSL